MPSSPSSRSDETDGYLVARAREGYLDAYEQLVVRHRDRAYAVALRLLAHRQDAEDATQEAFVDAWRALGRFDERASFATWLYRIVVNSCLTLARRRSPPGTLEPLDGHDPPGGIQPDTTVEAKVRAEALRRAVAGLPEDLRAPLVLHTFGGFSYDDTATILGASTATVRGRIARARRALLERMRAWA